MFIGAPSHADLARLLLRDVEVHNRNQKYWSKHETGLNPFKRRTTDVNARVQATQDQRHP